MKQDMLNKLQQLKDQLEAKDNKQKNDYEELKRQRLEAIKERDRRNGAIDKDVVFKKAYEYDKDRYYQVRATIDAFGKDKHDHETRIVSVNTIHMYINGEHIVANHTHLRGDRVKLDRRWRKGQEIVLNVKIQRYPHGTKDKYELVNIF